MCWSPEKQQGRSEKLPDTEDRRNSSENGSDAGAVLVARKEKGPPEQEIGVLQVVSKSKGEVKVAGTDAVAGDDLKPSDKHI